MKTLRLLRKLQVVGLMLLCQVAFSQSVGISTNSSTPNSNAMLDVASPATGNGKGLLIPRITYAQRTTASQTGGLLNSSGNLHGGAAQGLLVYQTDNSGDGEGFYYNTSTTSTPTWVYLANSTVSERGNHKLVKSLSDFPTPSSGVITLEDSISYEINGVVNIGTNRIVMGVANVIYGINKSVDKLIYTGSGNMITSSNQDFSIRTLLINAPTSGSKVFNIAGSTSNVQIVDNIFDECKDLGVFNGGEFLTIRSNLIDDCSDGFEFKGTLEHLFYIENLHEDNGGTLITIPSGTFHAIMISNNYFDVDDPADGLDITTSGTTVSDAKIVNNFFVGDGDYITGVSTAYAEWFFYGNTDLPDSDPYGELVIHSNTTATSIASKNHYYKASGVNYSSSFELFDTNGVNNRLRYTGSKKIGGSYTVSGSLKVATSGKKVKVAVYKNGIHLVKYTQLTPSNTTSEFNFSLSGHKDMHKNDYFEIFVFAQSTAFDITITELNFKVED